MLAGGFLSPMKKALKRLSQIRGRARVPFYILYDKAFRIFKPRVAVLTVNNACNLSCRYCFGGYCERSSSDDFTTEELKSIIDDLKRNGTIYLTVHGGETLLRHDIGEIIRHIKGRGIYVNLITNGVLVKKRLHEISDIDGACVSLDGREENNDYVRGKGSFRSAMTAIGLFKAAGIPLRVHATLTKYTRNDISYLAGLSREKGFHLEFSLLFKSTPDIRSLMLSDAETRDALREIIGLKKEGYPIFTSLRSLNLALNWPYSYEKTTLSNCELKDGLKPIPCCYKRHKFTIDANGMSFPCFPLNKEFKGLDVRAVGVKKAFENVVRNTECVLCPFLTQNDWSYMMTLDPMMLLEQARLQVKELVGL
jgi:MoaA/NifB/PqqE/SkfB family radical SAM enzyme